ncbi:ABC transporter substrate-binding protein [Moraxella caviae]|uniref:ABC transporter arginine-binding protein 2 n=1 Tax=Moraxella caviae TaxID=34060 RepID=A0A1T0A5F4_9GAMM|nr:transporter substrate-binding domain-containing protein [Moraxella caviae]OOR90818.1 ABC transporter substrate-binding protein [Moraxella caviae]STZ10646.1 Putative ABC transporter arginine-binding protein 2 precursor [Moraxella caviae]VEW10553.1 Putative ABC transporter arginine-binding protein 2 precursor [Moraxella caviae]
MNIKLMTAAVATALLAACGGDKPAETSNSGEKFIRIATESSFKPFSYLDNQGNLVGFEIDLANALCEEMKAKCEISSQDWDGLIPGLNADKFDAIMAGMSATAERAQVVDFSEPYFDNTIVLIGKKGVDADANALAGKTVAAQLATVSADWVSANQPQATLKTYDKQDNAYLDLSAGRADVMMSDIVPALDWLKTEAGQDFEVKGEPIDIGDTVAIAVRKGDALKAEFDAALAALKTNGKYNEIVGNYFDASVVGK